MLPLMNQPANESQNRGPLASRLTLAVLIGLCVASLSLLAVWGDMRKVKTLRTEQWKTRQELKFLGQAIRLSQSHDGSPPDSLSRLGLSSASRAAGGGRPFIYSVNGTNWTVLSYGRDGKPGGVGSDADLTNWKPEPAESQVLPTFYEFVFELEQTGMATISTIICGVLAGWLSFFTVGIPKGTRRELLRVGLTLLATLIGATFIAFMIGGLEVPHH
jgi:hypothetical protein